MCNGTVYNCKCPGSVKPLKIEVGKTYLDKSGQKVRIICIDRVCRIGAPVVGLVGPGQQLESYLNDGKRAMSMEDNSSFDLVSEFLPPNYRWFNAYDIQSGDVYTIKYWRGLASARENLSKSYKHIGTYRIDLNTGDIVKESV